MLKAVELENALRTELKNIGEKDKKLSESISPIIFSNLEKGRIEHYLNSRRGAVVRDYVLHVATHYERWHDYVSAVQVERQDDVWEALLNKIRRWVYLYLQRKYYSIYKNVDTRSQVTNACANEAAVFLMNADFPYDVDFDAWLYVLTLNAVRKTVEKDFSLNEVQSNELVLETLDEMLLSAEQMRRIELIHFELREDVLSAITQLSQVQQHVVLGYYFDGKSLSELANELDVSANVIYKRHFDALKNLRIILSKKNYDF
mgnify:CR=1 FL=1